VLVGVGIFLGTAAPTGHNWQVMLLGRVTDACTGSPVGGASVTVTPVDVLFPPGPPIRSNNGGHFLLKLDSTSDVLVSVQADGYAPVGGITNTDGDVQVVSPPIAVSWPSGQVVQNIDVMLTPLHPPSPCLLPGPPLFEG
jgi:hypothetical protein